MTRRRLLRITAMCADAAAALTTAPTRVRVVRETQEWPGALRAAQVPRPRPCGSTERELDRHVSAVRPVPWGVGAVRPDVASDAARCNRTCGRPCVRAPGLCTTRPDVLG